MDEILRLHPTGGRSPNPAGLRSVTSSGSDVDRLAALLVEIRRDRDTVEAKLTEALALAERISGPSGHALPTASDALYQTGLPTQVEEHDNEAAMLREQLIILHAKRDDAQSRMVRALESNDLLGLVAASREQGAVCTEQGALLADYIAKRVSALPDVDPAYRERVNALARQLRDEHHAAGTKTTG